MKKTKYQGLGAHDTFSSNKKEVLRGQSQNVSGKMRSIANPYRSARLHTLRTLSGTHYGTGMILTKKMFRYRIHSNERLHTRQPVTTREYDPSRYLTRCAVNSAVGTHPVYRMYIYKYYTAGTHPVCIIHIYIYIYVDAKF